MSAFPGTVNDWPGLIAKVREAMGKGLPPDSPEVVQLAARWRELTELFTGGDPDLTKSAERYYQEHPDMVAQTGIDGELHHYIKRAMSSR